nr:H419 [uncultured bacterium]
MLEENAVRNDVSNTLRLSGKRSLYKVRTVVDQTTNRYKLRHY